ncbi:hypothetical protein ACRWQM_12945 [Shewanella sp. HL-SH5]|uniref:hypothetical protein n=1 Tax=Shewanella sp. HL-SH5 TaxID=3436241 RepID=UPI003EB9946C
MLKSILKIAVYSVASIIFLLALIFAVLVYINIEDRYLSVNTQQLEKWAQLETVNESQNAFVLAQQIVGTQQAPLILPLSDVQHLLLQQYQQTCHKELIENCHNFIAGNLVDVKFMLTSHVDLINQYQQIITLPLWHESLDNSADRPQINFTNLSNIQMLAELNALLSSRTGSPSFINDFIDADYRFWNNIFHSSSDLATFSLAGSKMQKNLAWGVKILAAEAPLNGTYPAAWKLSSKLSEESIQRVFAAEYLFVKAVMIEMLSNTYPLSDINYYQQWLISLFFKLNDSLNMNAERVMNQYQQVIKNQLSEAMVRDSMAGLKAKDEQNEQSFAYCDYDSTIEKIWAMKYNPIGKVISCLNTDMVKYFEQSEKITQLQKQSIQLRKESKKR